MGVLSRIDNGILMIFHLRKFYMFHMDNSITIENKVTQILIRSLMDGILTRLLISFEYY